MSTTEEEIEKWADTVLNGLTEDDAWCEFVDKTLGRDLEIRPIYETLVDSEEAAEFENSAEYKLWWEANTALIVKVLATAITKARFFRSK
jgi:hypothetical protein